MDTKGSKKQKRERIQKKWRVPSARWATNGVENATNGGENALRTVLRVPLAQWLWICFRLGPRICFMNEWESESEFERAERKGVTCVSNFLLCVCNDRCVFVCVTVWEINDLWISSLINSISTWLHLAFLSS